MKLFNLKATGRGFTPCPSTPRRTTKMTREMQQLVKKTKLDSAELVRYANPKSKTIPSLERITEILSGNIPYRFCEGKPTITNIRVTEYHRNHIIKTARFKVETSNNRTFEITAYQHLTGRTPEEKEADKTADFPSGLFKIFHKEII